jgi:MOSC domain-containing protein YiiM
MARIIAVCRSESQGYRKQEIDSGFLRAEHGLEDDAHAGPWHRQVSLLAEESIEKMRARGFELVPGDFAENLTTRGIDLLALPVGTRLRLGPQAVGEVTQIGKRCHGECEILRQTGDCVMPREGIFIRILQDGPVGPGDPIRVMEESEPL